MVDCEQPVYIAEILGVTGNVKIVQLRVGGGNGELADQCLVVSHHFCVFTSC